MVRGWIEGGSEGGLEVGKDDRGRDMVVGEIEVHRVLVVVLL